MDLTAARARIRNIIDSETTAYFSNGELEEFMKMATDEFVQQYYMGFETTQDNRDKLSKLVESTEQDIKDGTAFSTSSLTTDTLSYGRFLSAYVKDNPNVNVKVIQIEDMSAYLNDPFNKADDNNPVIYFKSGSIYSIGLSSLTKIVITYLQYTTDFTDLSGETHEEICQIAARKVLATLGDPRYQMVQAEITERRV